MAADAGRLKEWVREQVASRVPKADLDQRDPDYIREQLPMTWLIASLYFRADVQHLDRIPGRVRSCSSATTAAATCRPTPSSSRWRSAPTSASSGRSISWPTTSSFRRRRWAGCASSAPSPPTPTTRDWRWSPVRALLVYPGGDYEVFRPSWERHKVDFDGRMGYVKLAREAGVPIVPVASVGGQESCVVPVPRAVAGQVADGR